MKILVAGGAGYVGSALVPKLLERGYEIEVVDLLWFGNCLPADVRVNERDVFALAEKDLEGYDPVIFVAGLSNDPMAEYSPARNFVFNSAAPAYLAYIAKQAGVSRFIYASTCSVYGYAADRLYDEDAPTDCVYPYGISKLQGERAVLQMVAPGFSAIALRKGTVSGYSPRMRLDLIVNTMFRTAACDGVINVSNPAIWRPVLSLRDAVDAYTRAVEASDTVSGVFNVSSGNYTVGEVADIVREEAEKLLERPIKLSIRHDPDFRNYKVDTEKARNVLSFKPRDDISDIVGTLHTNLERFSDFDRPAFYNIRAFREMDQARGGDLDPAGLDNVQ